MRNGSNYVTTSSDGTVFAKRCIFYGIVITPDGTNDVSVAIYDNTAASGDKPVPTMTFSGDGGTQFLSLPAGVRMNTGIYVDVTTVGTVEYTVYYDNL